MVADREVISTRTLVSCYMCSHPMSFLDDKQAIQAIAGVWRRTHRDADLWLWLPDAKVEDVLREIEGPQRHLADLIMEGKDLILENR